MATAASAQAPGGLPADPEPLLRLEPGGPTASVSALAFSPDGKTLYSAGLDKVVRIWNLDPQTNRFELDSYAYRVPIGPGPDGVINTIAVSADGTWLAAAGLGVVRGGATFRQPGIVLPAIGGKTAEMWKDEGTIYVFNTKTRSARLLRGHRGSVASVAFAPAHPHKPPLLVAAAREWDEKANKFVGSLRLWNIDAAADKAYVDGIWDLPNPQSPPGLAVWHTGAELKQLRVGLAWNDSVFRVWDAGTNDLHEVKNGQYNNAVAYTPASPPLAKGGTGGGQIITSSFISPNGQIQLWNEAAGRAVRVNRDAVVRFPPAGRTAYFPRAFALFPSQAAGALDRAAVILRASAEPLDYTLAIVDLPNARVVTDGIPLWKKAAGVPSVAADPRGRFLALAGNEEHEILIYPLPLAERARPQRLRGVGTATRRVAFLTNQRQELGLLVGEEAKPRTGAPITEMRQGDRVFDFTARTLTGEQAGRRLFDPSADRWRVHLEGRQAGADRTRWQFNWSGPEMEGQTDIELKAKETLTDYLILPPLKPLTGPVLALAIWDTETNQPLLALYNARTGDQVRQFKGHVEPIRCLAASRDGKLLASAADDQLVNIWSLIDLGQVLGRRGLVKGLAVKQDEVGKPVVVGQVHDDSPARGKLATGDEVEGLVMGDNQVRRFASPRDFYDSVSRLRPGDNITLRVRGKGNVRLPVAQGIDERKPLLSLFFMRGGRDDHEEWLAWNPVGPFESSGPNAERYLGWHFNTGKADAPTSFALAKEYRDKYYRAGILKHLVAFGDLSRALDAWKKEQGAKRLPKPQLTVWVAELGLEASTDAPGPLLLRQPKATVKLAVDGLPSLEAVDSVTWQLDGAAPQPFDKSKASGQELSAELAVKPGVHKVRIVLRTREEEPQESTKEISFRYQKPAPRIEYSGPRRAAVSEPTFRLQAAVHPGVPDEKLQVRLTHGKQDVPVKAQPAADKPTIQLDQAIERLEVGDNIIELVARNEAALADYQDFETDRLAIVVTYTPKEKVPPPQIALESVAVENESIAIAPGKPVTVNDPKVRLIGKITAKKNLVQADWQSKKAGDVKKTLSGFETNKAAEYSIREAVSLAPGPQEFVFTAKTEDSDPSESRVTVVYQPRLPELALETPAPDLVIYEEERRPETDLKGRLVPPKDPQAFQVRVQLNDKEVASATTAGTLTAKLPLAPGDNRIQIKVSNAWGAERTYDTQARYLRPPRVLSLVEPKPSSKLAQPRANLVAQARSPRDLPLRADFVTLTVNRRPVPADALRLKPVEGDAKDFTVWSIEADNIDVLPGKNEVTLRVRNADADGRALGLWDFTYEPPRPAKKASVEFLQPKVNTSVTEPRQELRFRIESETALKRVELVHGDRRENFDVSRITKNVDGQFELDELKGLELNEGSNDLRVIAINAAGEQDATVTVSYTPLPVRLDLDEPSYSEVDRKPRIPVVEQAEVRLRGHVTWHKPSDEKRIDQNPLVRLYVNGFQQRPTELKPRSSSGSQREFETRVVLNRKIDNHIEIELPGLAQEAGARRGFWVNCSQPQQPKTLHLLVVGIGEEETKDLTDRVRRSLAKREQTAFDQVIEYPAVGDDITPGKICNKLRIIMDRVKTSAAGGLPNDVVMVYWAGKEVVTDSGHYFLTSQSRYDPVLTSSAVSRATLEQILNSTLGARVVMLDLARDMSNSSAVTNGESPSERYAWIADPRVAAMRYSWRDPVGANAHLAKSLEDALKKPANKGVTLGDVESEADRAAEQPKKAGKLMKDFRVPDSLKPLLLGQRP